MNNYKGDIAGFPTEVVEKMLERQVEQGNERDVSVFDENRNNPKNYAGFNWYITKEGKEFWTDVIYFRDFNIFFKRYPKTENNV